MPDVFAAARYEIGQQLAWNVSLLLRLGIPAVLAVVCFLAGQRWARHQMRAHWHAWVDASAADRIAVLAARNAQLTERLRDRDRAIAKLDRACSGLRARHQAMVAAAGLGEL